MIAAAGAEPDVLVARQAEAIFEQATIQEISVVLERANIGWTPVKRFGLDLALFFEAQSQWRFLEFKAFTGQRPNGCGFGTPKGTGPQVELLKLPETELAHFDPFIRFALVDGTQPVGAARFALFKPTVAKQAAMGVVCNGKQNNFRVSFLMKAPLTWNEFVAALADFIL